MGRTVAHVVTTPWRLHGHTRPPDHPAVPLASIPCIWLIQKQAHPLTTNCLPHPLILCHVSPATHPTNTHTQSRNTRCVNLWIPTLITETVDNKWTLILIRFLCKSSDFSLQMSNLNYIFFFLSGICCYSTVRYLEWIQLCIYSALCMFWNILFFPLNFRKVSLSLQILPPLPCSALYLLAFHSSLLFIPHLFLVNKLFLEQF